MTEPLRRNAGLAFGSLLASAATLLCCVLPAVLVSLGAGAAVVGLVSAIPQLIWLSERKGWVFAIAGALLVASAIFSLRARRLPCPAEPAAARSCLRLRRLSTVMWWVSAGSLALGATFAFLLPRMLD